MSEARGRWIIATLFAFAAAGGIVAVRGAAQATAGRGDKRAAPLASNWPAPPAPARDRWQSWNPIPITQGVSGFWATGPGDVWAWGGAEVMRWDGRAWSRAEVPVGMNVSQMWGKPQDIWLRAAHYTPEHSTGCEMWPAKFDTSLFHFDGVAWTSVESRSHEGGRGDAIARAPLGPPADATKAVSRDELVALWKERGDGRPMPAFTSGYRSGGGEIWAMVGDGRQIAHLDRSGWKVGGRLAWGNFSSVRMTSADDGWAVSRREWDHTGGSNDVHLGGPGGDGLFRWDGHAWNFARDLPERVLAMWASGADDVWAVGQKGLVMHWDGARWSEQRLTGEFRAIWGAARDDVWLNGCADNFYHWNGKAWSRVPNPIQTTHWGVCPVLWGTTAVDVNGPTGYDRHSLRWNGAAWKYDGKPFKEAGGTAQHEPSDETNSPYFLMTQRISALWGSPSGADLWAVGQEGARTANGGFPVILRRNRDGWSRSPVPRVVSNLYGVWGDRDDNVWAVGTNGLILHWDGTSWTKEDSGVTLALMSIHGAGSTVWIVGDRGTMLVRALAPPKSPPSP